MSRRTIRFESPRGIESAVVSQPRGRVLRGFTLIELLVVVGIIGILAAISLPAMKGIGQANVTAAANRQLLDDLAYARLRALSDRTTVYMVFVPPYVGALMNSPLLRPEDRRVVSNLLGGQYTTYALISTRTVGDQPGQAAPRYLTEWKSLPDGMLIDPAKFARTAINPVLRGRVFATNAFLPFPKSRAPLLRLPHVAFNAKGQLISGRDELIPLVRGSVFYPRDARGNIDPGKPADVQLIPPRATTGAGTNDYQVVRVNWVTGRARIEGPEFEEAKR